jgi:tRNA U34 5-methylaminomethyl-2-thiouridine-forming methyltransferase MnmC
MFKPELTADGSFTFFSEEFQELFHSHQGAKKEAEQKFSQPCHLVQQAQQNSRIQILDICYGLGYNSAAALETIWSVNPHCQIELIALEINADVPTQAIAENLLYLWDNHVIDCLTKLIDQYHYQTENLTATLLIGDARTTIQSLDSRGFLADAIFLDPFSPPKCPQLWTAEFLNLVGRCLKPKGRLATYSCAASVRTALQLAGLNIGPTPGVGRRSPGTVASFDGHKIPPLSQQEQEHLKTRSAIPYRDPLLQDSATEIRERRLKEQDCSFLESSSQWKKRWLVDNNSVK